MTDRLLLTQDQVLKADRTDETFIEYGVSVGGKEPFRTTWTASHPVAFRDFATYREIFTDVEVELLQRYTVMKVSDWEPAVRPEEPLEGQDT